MFDTLYVKLLRHLRELIEFLFLLTCFNSTKKFDVNPVVVGGAGMKKTLVNCEAVSFADAPLVKVSQTHLLSCQTPELVIMN